MTPVKLITRRHGIYRMTRAGLHLGCFAASGARPAARIVPLAAALLASPFMLAQGLAVTAMSSILGAGLIALSLRRGPIRGRYGQ
jgi:hypothetical protein